MKAGLKPAPRADEINGDEVGQNQGFYDPYFSTRIPRPPIRTTTDSIGFPGDPSVAIPVRSRQSDFNILAQINCLEVL
jgi:hypothetical protein